GWGREHERTFIADDGDAPRAGTLFHRRSGRCHRLAGRLQFPVGLGEWTCRGRGCLTSKRRCRPAPESGEWRRNMKTWIGTSGFQYTEWKGNFYPEDLPASKML